MPLLQAEGGRGRGWGRGEMRRESIYQRGQGRRGRGRASTLSMQPKRSKTLVSTVSFARDYEIERKQTMTTRNKATIAIVVLLIVLAGVGAGLYFGLAKSNKATDTTPTATPTPMTTTTRATTTKAPDRYTTASTIDEEKWLTIRGDCGRPTNKPNLGRIVGGTEAVKHSWPWQIGLLKYKRYSANTATVKAICGGTLVGPKFVITATHCFLNSRRTSVTTNVNEFKVLVGGHEKGKETSGAKMLDLAKINHHPDNNLATFTRLRQIPIHDISVLELDSVVDPNVLSPMTAFACLPKPKLLPPVGKKCWATGWGKVQGTGFDRQLKQVVQPIASEAKCKKKYGSRGITEKAHLCAGPHEGSQGTCQGDSGGPLVCQYDDGAWVLHGATSFGPQPCGTSPAVWAQVSYHMNWVCCILKDYGPCKDVKCRT